AASAPARRPRTPEAAAAAPAEVDPPATVAPVVERKPTAALVVTAWDAGAPVKDFKCGFGAKTGTPEPLAAVDGRVETIVHLASAAGDRVEVTAARGDASGRREIALRDGDRVEV